MKKLLLFGTMLAVAAGVPLWVQYRASNALSEKQKLLQQAGKELASLVSENKRLAGLVAPRVDSQSLSPADLEELLKLRNEQNQLRRTTNDLVHLQNEVRRLRNAIQELDGLKAGGEDSGVNPDEKIPDRVTRVARLREWLAVHPQEHIPEMQLLTEGTWMRSANGERDTDEELQAWMSSLRTTAASRFAKMTSQALQQYAQANNGQFPTEVSQLQPYYEMPMDDAVFERYEIVPSKSLIPSLAATNQEPVLTPEQLTKIDSRTGQPIPVIPPRSYWRNADDPVITQKAPVNAQLDVRFAISASGFSGTSAKGAWDPVK